MSIVPPGADPEEGCGSKALDKASLTLATDAEVLASFERLRDKKDVVSKVVGIVAESNGMDLFRARPFGMHAFERQVASSDQLYACCLSRHYVCHNVPGP